MENEREYTIKFRIHSGSSIDRRNVEVGVEFEVPRRLADHAGLGKDKLQSVLRNMGVVSVVLDYRRMELKHYQYGLRNDDTHLFRPLTKVRQLMTDLRKAEQETRLWLDEHEPILRRLPE